jgi:hypothetical protein
MQLLPYRSVKASLCPSATHIEQLAFARTRRKTISRLINDSSTMGGIIEDDEQAKRAIVSESPSPSAPQSAEVVETAAMPPTPPIKTPCPTSSESSSSSSTPTSFRQKYQQIYRPGVLYGLTFVVVSASAGLVYGWPALRRNLLEDDGSTLTENQFGVIFTVGSWSTQGGRFFSFPFVIFKKKLNC